MLKPSILIVDDEAGVRSALSGVLRDEGYAVDAVESGEACLDRVSRAPYDVIVLDIWLPGIDGLATLARLQERRVDTPLAQTRERHQTVDTRQPDVQHDDVVRRPEHAIQARFSALDGIDRVPLITQHAAERASHAGFVVDDQDSWFHENF